MAKPYTEQLADWVKSRKSSRQEKNLAAFLAVKPDVMGALESGFPAKTIWMHLKELKRIEFGYDTFLNLVKRHEPASAKKSENKNLSTGVKDNPTESTKEVKPKDTESPTKKVSGFRYNPTPNLKELI